MSGGRNARPGRGAGEPATSGLAARLRRLPATLGWRARMLTRRTRLAASLRRVHGPRRFALAADDVVVVVLVRDGLFYLDRLLAHHRSLGARHFVFVDNGSTDGTVERLRGEEGCVVLRTDLPFLHYEVLAREAAARRYARGHWVLFSDTDEMFDFAGSDVLGLPGLARYLAGRGHTAMVAQMLEMFPRGPILAQDARPYDDVLEDCRHYDLSAVEAHDYRRFPLGWSGIAARNAVSDARVTLMTGGIRAKVFGEACGLSKHPLVFLGEGVTGCAHPHCAAGATVSDVTGVIRHYKFTDGSFARDRLAATGTRGNTREARARLDALEADPALSLFSDEARTWSGPEALHAEGFLVRSEAYEAHVAARRRA